MNEKPLKWAEDDAERVHTLLTELGDVPADQAVLLRGGTAADLRLALLRFRQKMMAAAKKHLRTELVFFYSGHGDSDALHLGNERFGLDDLMNAIAQTTATTTVTIIDACRGRDTRNKGATRGPAFEINLSRENAPSGHVTIFSAGQDEVAQESDAVQGSLFSHHLLSGLRGAADVDQDQHVTLGELYQYTYNTTIATSHGLSSAVQHPEMDMFLKGEGAIVLTTIDQYTARLVIPTRMAGDFLIVDDRSARVVAQFQKSDDRPISLALLRGRFRIQQRTKGNVYAGVVDLRFGGDIVLEQKDMVYQQPALVAKKGRRLNPKPWSLNIDFLFGTPAVLGEDLLLGGALRFSHELDNWEVGIQLQGGEASAGNPMQQYRHVQGQLGIGLFYRIHAGPAIFWLGASTGCLIVWQWTKRLKPALTTLEPETSFHYDGLDTGGYLSFEFDVQFEVWRSFSIVLRFEALTRIIRVEGSLDADIGFLGATGIGYSF